MPKIIERQDFEPGDIEAFLALNGKHFICVEYNWTNVHDVADEIRAANLTGFYQLKDPFSGGTVMQRADPSMPRAGKKVIGSSVDTLLSQLIRNARHKATPEKITKMAAHMVANRARESVEDLAKRSVAEWEREQNREANPEESSISAPEDLYASVQKLIAHYLVAFGSQEVATNHIETMLKDDANVMPFVARLHETMELRSSGINEFTGLLEIVGTLVAQQQAARGTSSLEEAIMRVSGSVQSPEDFTRRMLSEESPSVEGQPSKDFLASVAGTKMVAETVVAAFGDAGVDQDTLVSALTQHLGSVTNGNAWRAAYQNDTTARAKATWRSLYTKLRQFERKGRIPEILDAPTEVTSKKQRRRSTNLTDTELRDITIPRQPEAEPTLPDLAVMKQVGETLFSLEHVDDLEALMEHAIVTRFLRKYTGSAELRDTVRSYLDGLMRYPTDPFFTIPLADQRFSLNAAGFPAGKEYRLRRFRPSATLAEANDPLNRRVRILYGLVPYQSRKLLLINTVTLRDDDTY